MHDDRPVRYCEDPAKVVRNLHEDLSRMWRLYELDISEAWHGYDESERMDLLVGDMPVRFDEEQTAEERNRGSFFFLIPELNFRDLKPEADLFLNHLEYRAGKSLLDQFHNGWEDRPGDGKFIRYLMLSTDVPYHEVLDGKYRSFDSEKPYGDQIPWTEAFGGSDALDENWNNENELNKVQPNSVGNCILGRQMHALQYLNMVTWQILARHWKKQMGRTQGQRSEGPGAMSLINLCVSERSPSTPLSDLAEMASENKKSLEDWTGLCRSNSRYLVKELYTWFFTQPAHVPDDDNRLLYARYNRQVSSCLFEMFHSFVSSAGVWDYITHLLRSLAGCKDNDRFSRSAILQELVNVIDFEYERCQVLLTRYTLRTIGIEYVKRIDNSENTPKIVPRFNPEALTRADPFAHYVLRLYKAETKVGDALPWVQKIFGIYKADRELEAIQGPRDIVRELAAVVGLHRQLKQLVRLPPSHARKGRRYINQVTAMAPEIESIKESLDLSDIAVPPDHLYCPGAREAAFNKIDEVIEDYTGTQLCTLYDEISDSCMADIGKACEEMLAEAQRFRDMRSNSIPCLDEQVRGLRLEERRTKTKTRPSQPSDTPSDRLSSRPSSPERATMLKVKQDSYKVFEMLLSRNEPRRALSWTSFMAAMTELGFSINHRYGSIVTFEPPSSLSYLKSFTFHRPHGAHIEGYRLLWLARRLKRVYEWTIDSFELEQ